MHRYEDPPLPIISILFTLSNLKSALLVQIGLSVLTANPDEPFRGQHSWLEEEQDQKALKNVKSSKKGAASPKFPRCTAVMSANPSTL